MRIEPRSIARFLNRPPSVRVALFHGADEGLVRSRADEITVGVIGARDDPFRVAWLFKDDHGRLAEEASAIAMMGGRRVIRVRDAADSLTPAILRCIGGAGDSLIVLETDALPKRSKLRTALEDSPQAGVVACYPAEGPALRAMAEQYFREVGATITVSAMAAFLARVGADAGTIRSEAGKLALYVGSEASIGLDDVVSAVGDLASGSVDDALYAATAGQFAAADRSLEVALDAGAAPVAICRILLGHLNRLQDAAAGTARGLSAADAARSVRPPLLFTRLPQFTAAVPLWPAKRLAAAISAVTAAELACKQTNARDGLVVRRLLLGISQMAARAR